MTCTSTADARPVIAPLYRHQSTTPVHQTALGSSPQQAVLPTSPTSNQTTTNSNVKREESIPLPRPQLPTHPPRHSSPAAPLPSAPSRP